MPTNKARSSARSKTVSLDPLVNLLADDMRAVNAMIMKRLSSDVPLIPELAGHLIAAGGKRIRPMMTLAGAKITLNTASKKDAIIGLATAVEFIHSATLLHDDVIDESNLRRGRDTANLVWGNEASVLVGDFLFARAFELMVEAGDINVLGRLANASAQITEGEIKQMTIAGRPDTPQGVYFDVITGKTAILFAAAAAAGAQIAGANADDVLVMHDYGLKLGLAFQVMDDAMDYALTAGSMGKNVGDDFRERKLTLPFIKAISKADDKERAFWVKTIEKGEQGKGDLEIALELLNKHGAIDSTRLNALEWAKKAQDAISQLPGHEIRDILNDLPLYIIERVT